MATWKVLLVGVFFLASVGLAVAAVVVPFNYDGNRRWLWMAGMIAANVVWNALFALFLKFAGRELPPRSGR